MAEQQDGSTNHIPSGYFDLLILAPEEDVEKADVLRREIEDSTEMGECLGRFCRVEMIEEASGDNSDFLSLVDKGIDATPMVLAIISEEYCNGHDEEAMSKFTMILSDRIQKRGHDKVLLVPVYTPKKLSDSAWNKLPRFITMLHSYTFDPGDGKGKTRFFKRLSGMMSKSPFKNRMKNIIDKLVIEEGKKRLEEEKISFDLQLKQYHNKTKHLREMRTMQQEMQKLQTEVDVSGANMPTAMRPFAEYSFPSGQLRGPSDPIFPASQDVARGATVGYPFLYSPTGSALHLTPQTVPTPPTSQPRDCSLGNAPHSGTSENPVTCNTVGAHSPSPSLGASARPGTSPQLSLAGSMSEPTTLPDQNHPLRDNIPTFTESGPVSSRIDQNVHSGSSPSVSSMQSSSINAGSGQGVLPERSTVPYLYTPSNTTVSTSVAPQVASTHNSSSGNDPQLSQEDERSEQSNSSHPLVPNLFGQSISTSSSGSEAEQMRSHTVPKTVGFPIQETQQGDLNLSQHGHQNSDERTADTEAGARGGLHMDGTGNSASVNMPMNDQRSEDLGGINSRTNTMNTLGTDAELAPAAPRLHVDGLNYSVGMSASDQADRQNIPGLVDSAGNEPHEASFDAARAPPTDRNYGNITGTRESQIVTSDVGVSMVQQSMNETEFDFRSDYQLQARLPESALVTATSASISGEAFRGLAHTEENATGES